MRVTINFGQHTSISLPSMPRLSSVMIRFEAEMACRCRRNALPLDGIGLFDRFEAMSAACSSFEDTISPPSSDDVSFYYLILLRVILLPDFDVAISASRRQHTYCVIVIVSLIFALLILEAYYLFVTPPSRHAR